MLPLETEEGMSQSCTGPWKISCFLPTPFQLGRKKWHFKNTSGFWVLLRHVLLHSRKGKGAYRQHGNAPPPLCICIQKCFCMPMRNSEDISIHFLTQHQSQTPAHQSYQASKQDWDLQGSEWIANSTTIALLASSPTDIWLLQEAGSVVVQTFGDDPAWGEQASFTSHKAHLRLSSKLGGRHGTCCQMKQSCSLFVRTGNFAYSNLVLWCYHLAKSDNTTGYRFSNRLDC